jgi:hypothetical protein
MITEVCIEARKTLDIQITSFWGTAYDEQSKLIIIWHYKETNNLVLLKPIDERQRTIIRCKLYQKNILWT